MAGTAWTPSRQRTFPPERTNCRCFRARRCSGRLHFSNEHSKLRAGRLKVVPMGVQRSAAFHWATVAARRECDRRCRVLRQRRLTRKSTRTREAAVYRFHKGLLVITVWCSVALGSILSISFAATPAQYNPHLGLNKQDQDALAKHELTVRNRPTNVRRRPRAAPAPEGGPSHVCRNSVGRAITHLVNPTVKSGSGQTSLRLSQELL